MLKINNLHVKIDGKKILKGVNLSLEKGKIHALMGPNGSGKSTLANVLIGHPKYEIIEGSITLDGQNIIDLSPDKRAKKGLFLSYQYPQEIEGITISNFLRTAYNLIHEKKMSILEFRKYLEEKAKILSIDNSFLSRYLNFGFSGGEKKRAEILQLLVLDPKVAILDETDSGLDIDALKAVADGIKQFMNKDKTILIITHYKRILEYLRPDKVSIMIGGKIVTSGGSELVNQLEEKGYSWLE